METNNMRIYEQVRQVPESAQKKITGGRLNGMTDINPMWRISKLTEIYGPCGEGWYTDNVRYTVQYGANEEQVVICELELRVKHGEDFGTPIYGVGGSMLVAKERNGLFTSDEAFKMAYTDAISVACKALGFGADIYWSAGRTKYSKGDKNAPATKPKKEEKLDMNAWWKSVTDLGYKKEFIEQSYNIGEYMPLTRAEGLAIYKELKEALKHDK